MTVTTLFPSADGSIESEHSTYATARAGASLAAASAGTSLQLGQRPGYTIEEVFLAFDTSGIGDSDSIDDVELQMYCTFANAGQVIEVRLHDWGGTLETSDWVAGASLSGKTLLATLDTDAITVNAYNSFVAEAAFLSNINKTGTTYLLLSIQSMRLGTTPTDDELVVFRSVEQTGTTQDPKLVITHTAVITTGLATAQARAYAVEASQLLALGLASATARAYEVTQTGSPSLGAATATARAYAVMVNGAVSLPVATAQARAYAITEFLDSVLAAASASARAYEVTVTGGVAQQRGYRPRRFPAGVAHPSGDAARLPAGHAVHRQRLPGGG